jgi:YesN/AraC family two-component response regulator
MERAKKLLTSTGMSLPEIAYSLGYKQYSYFSRLFTKKVGQSPASFRKDYLYAKEDEL